jgi:bacterioferritin-associated ferredoxin
MGQQPNQKSKRRSEIICKCNNVSKQTIETAITQGCRTLNEIFDMTTAGVGPCGGSCRRKLGPLLNHFLATGAFPDKIIEDLTGKSVTPGSALSGVQREEPSAEVVIPPIKK